MKSLYIKAKRDVMNNQRYGYWQVVVAFLERIIGEFVGMGRSAIKYENKFVVQ
jgi:hypothetical protein